VEPHLDYAEPTAAVGDRVVVIRSADAAHVGKIGKVSSLREPGKVYGDTIPRVYVVYTADGGPLIEATKVARVAGEPVQAATVTNQVHVVPGTAQIGQLTPVAQIDGQDVYVDVQRLQAAQAAHSIWGKDADLDKLVGTAEWVLGQRTLGTETTGTVGVPPQRTILGQLQVQDGLSFGVRPPRPADRTLRDKDGDEIGLRLSPTDGQEVEVAVNGAAIAYATGDNLDALIQYLTQARDYIRRA